MGGKGGGCKLARDIGVRVSRLGLGTNNVRPGKKQNDNHFDVAMVLLSAPVPFCHEPNISIFNQ